MTKKYTEILNTKVSIKLIILLLFIATNLIGFCYSVLYKKYNGDFLNYPVKIDNITLFIIFIIILAQFLLVYFYFTFLNKKINVISLLEKQNVTNIFYYALFIFLIINFIITFYLHFPIAGQPYNYKFAFLITRIKVVDAALILYCLERTNKNKHKLFWIIVIGAIALNLYRGWTLHLFMFISIELLIIYKAGIKLNKVIYLCIASLIILIFVYPKIYDLKQHQRGTENSNTSIVDGLVHITGRFSHFSQTALIFEKKHEVIRIMQNELGRFHYCKDALSVFLPVKCIPDYDDKRTLHTYMAAGFNEQFDFDNMNSSFITGIAGKLIAIELSSKYDAIVYILFVLFLIFVNIVVCKKIHPDCIYFAFIHIIYYTLSGNITEIVNPGFQVIIWGTGIYILNFISKKYSRKTV